MKCLIAKIPSTEQELILAHILKKSRDYVLTHADLALNKTQKAEFEKMVNRLKKHEPLAYILGHKEFYGLDFKVDKNTLIPRPETELLVEEVIKLNPKKTNILDIGTGSGNIIIALAKNIGEKNNFFGIDISPKALRVAKYNAKKNRVAKKIKFLKGNLLKSIINNKKLFFAPCSLIFVANLPYLSKKIYNSVSPDIKNFEPKSALLSGYDGLDHYKKLFFQIKTLIKSCYVLRATCYVEISPEQKTKIEKLAKKYFPKARISFSKDLAGKWRIAKIKL